MGGYTKNIAVIKSLKDGFSADGGPLTGLVKAEKYGSGLKIEVTYINFAPLTKGRYVTAVSDGSVTEVVEDGYFEGTSPLDTSQGFAALVCYINGSVSPIASAISGNFAGAALRIKQDLERMENVAESGGGKTAAADGGQSGDTEKYEDEAIAEVNYYEFAETDKSGGTVRKDKKEEEKRNKTDSDEKNFSAFKKEQSGVDPIISSNFGNISVKNGLASGDFYKRVSGEIQNLFDTYPRENALEEIIENSRWIKISYGDNKYYVFGIINTEGSPRYICYGVPAEQSYSPPESMKGLASFVPASADDSERGYWVMYQDAATGASLKIQSK